MSSDSSFQRNDDEYDRTGHAGGTKDRLLGEMRSIANDAERMFHQVADTSSDRLSGMRAQIGRRLERTRDRLDTARRAVGENARVGTEAARGYVRARPLQAVGVATAAGVIVAVLILSIMNRRR